MPESDPLVAVVLPPREGFGPGRTGAVGLIAQRLAAGRGPFRTLVVGGEQNGPEFTAPAFRAVSPGWFDWGNINLRHAAAVGRVLKPLRPALVEVHNRPEMALSLARRLPEAKICLFLHNDPSTMRGSRSPAERSKLLRRLARVVTVSEYLRRRLLDGVAPADGRLPAVLPNCIDLGSLPVVPSLAGTADPVRRPRGAGEGAGRLRRRLCRCVAASARLAGRHHRRRPLPRR